MQLWNGMWKDMKWIAIKFEMECEMEYGIIGSVWIEYEMERREKMWNEILFVKWSPRWTDMKGYERIWNELKNVTSSMNRILVCYAYANEANRFAARRFNENRKESLQLQQILPSAILNRKYTTTLPEPWPKMGHFLNSNLIIELPGGPHLFSHLCQNPSSAKF